MQVVGSNARGFDNGRLFVEGNGAVSEQGALLLKDMPNCNAEQRPGKLDERQHGGYMKEEVKDSRSGR
ncbi:MAG: hypothetical protein LZF86_110731 [Nitrospira sp.]|nr:MAG: hypothetical protein LZF86_110731 [Nitrospira sp.]